jgi:hypothetical protein
METQPKKIFFRALPLNLFLHQSAVINLTTILLLPITSTSILHSFDYNKNETFQKEEAFGETEFAKLPGVDA